MRLIDADALLANRQILRGEDVIGIRDYVTVAEIENAPTIVQERETGEWIPQDHNRHYGNVSTLVYYYPICSKCGKTGDYSYAWCPHCGVKMEGR